MIDIIIVDYNAGEVLEACLASVEKAQRSGAGVGLVCVVVNGDVCDAVARRAARGVIKVEEPGRNIGFAAACNLGAAAGTAEHVLFLNPDTEVSAEALRAAAAALSKPGNERVGICGVALTAPDGTVARTCSEFPTVRHVLNKALGLGRLDPFRFKTGFMLDWDHASTREVDCVMGAFFLVRRSLFMRLGGFDERYFVYYEDLDFARRAKDLGLTTLFVHDASIRHVGRATTDRVPGPRLRYFLASRAAYMRKHLGAGAAFATRLIALCIEMPARVVHAVARGRRVDALVALRAWASLCAPPSAGGRAYRRWGKRALDVIACAVILPVLAPVLLVLAPLVRWRVGAPVVFRQKRAGLRGRPFTLCKFRTMTDTTDVEGRLRPDAERLTRFGSFLRRWSLDELPGLWNVLRGDMSLVGPRPLHVRYLGRYSPEQARRHDVRPGITGWAQVNGRNALTWEEKFRLDAWYVDHVSAAVDLRILLRTLARVLQREGISAETHVTMHEFEGSHK